MDNSFGLEGTSRLIPVNWRQNAAPEEGTSCRRLHRRILSILGWRYVRSPFLFSQVTMQSLSGNCRCQKARSGDSGDVMFPGLKAIRSRPSRCSARCAFGRFSAERRAARPFETSELAATAYDGVSLRCPKTDVARFSAEAQRVLPPGVTKFYTRDGKPTVSGFMPIPGRIRRPQTWSHSIVSRVWGCGWVHLAELLAILDLLNSIHHSQTALPTT